MSSHKFAIPLELADGHLLAGQAYLGSRQVLRCARGCGAFQAREGGPKAFRADGSEVLSCTFAGSSASGSSADAARTVVLAPVTVANFLLGVRLPTRAELDAAAYTPRPPHGDAALPPAPADWAQPLATPRTLLFHEADLALLRAATLLASATSVTVAPAAAARALSQIRIPISGVSGVEGQTRPLQDVIEDALLAVLSALGLQTMGRHIDANSAKYKHSPAAAYSFSENGTPVPTSFYWNVFQRTLAKDRAQRRADIWKVEGQTRALDVLSRPVSLDFYAPNASVVSAAPVLGLLRAARHTTEAEGAVSAFWAAWQATIVAAAASYKTEFKHVVAQRAAQRSDAGRTRAFSVDSESRASSVSSVASSNPYSNPRKRRRVRGSRGTRTAEPAKKVSFSGGVREGGSTLKSALKDGIARGPKSKCGNCGKWHRGVCTAPTTSASSAST